MTLEQTLAVRATVNSWVGRNFPEKRKYISHSNPVKVEEGEYNIVLHLKNGGEITILGILAIKNNQAALVGQNCDRIDKKLSEILDSGEQGHCTEPAVGENYQFHFDNGISAVSRMADQSIDFLLTDPPYSISKAYVCEEQIPRRLRKNGSDFIMPKGNFGDWDNNFPSPEEWTSIVLPKVKGWALIFCAQAQIGDYYSIMKDAGFVAVSPMVWHKTNPVPFNHKYKPINAWEAMVVGKRSGTKFNGHAIHNVFTHKSPSPQDRIHSTQKPDGLLSEFVRLFSKKGDLIVDPFAGSGSTIVATVSEGRRAIGYENDLTMFNKAKGRITRKLERLL